MSAVGNGRGERRGDGLVVLRQGMHPHGTLTLVRPWRSPLGVLIFVVTAAFAILLLAAPLVEGRSWHPVAFFLWPVFIASCGYVPAALALNRTRFHCAGGTLEIRHEPLPWPGKRQVDAGRIARIHVSERKNLQASHKNPEYVLEAVNDGGETEPLWKFNASFVSEEKVRAIARELSAFLGIPTAEPDTNHGSGAQDGGAAGGT